MRFIFRILPYTFLVLAFPIFASAQQPPSCFTVDGTKVCVQEPSNPAPPDPRPDPQSVAAAYNFQRQGIFDCNLNGAYSMSVGAISATGGSYVPVADFTTELNTGMLLYKECVLREVVDREREAAMSALGKKAVVSVLRGRNGNKMFVVNQRKESLEQVTDPRFLTFLKNEMGAVPSSMQKDIQRTLAKKYETETRNSGSVLGCSFKGDLAAFQKGTLPVNLKEFMAGMEPQCNPVFATYFAEDLSNSRIAAALMYQQEEWDRGNGYYSLSNNALDPFDREVYTPAITVQQSFQTILDSPVRQLENANDVGQMIGALYGGLTTQIISDTKGLSGLTQPVGSQPSYIDQVSSEGAQGVRNAAANAALQILNAARQVEGAYFQAVNAMAGILTQTIGQLRSAENQCWNLIIPKVCDGGTVSNNQCTDGGGTKYKIVKSTAFSQAIISDRVAPLASTTVVNVQASQKALSLIDQLIAGITNTGSLNAQRLALQQLDSLVAQKALHIKPDLDTVTGQLSSLTTAMQSLVENTVKAWADSPDPSVGWCNVNNPAVVSGWKDRWKE